MAEAEAEGAPGPAPALSVVIPHLEDAEGLARCLAALGAQRDAPPFEVIVVDNGSAAPPEALVRNAGGRLLHEPEPGPGPARTRGARAARAPFLGFIDSDCIADPDWAAALVTALSGEGAPDVVGGDVRIALRDAAAGPDGIEAYESVFGYRQALYVRRDRYAATCNMGVRRAVFDAVGPFAGIGIAEDKDWGQRASAMGYRIAYVPEMRIATPARGSFAALRRKWDRHIAHDFEELGRGGRLGWTARAVALAVSPAAELVRIWRSDRLSSTPARLKAAGVVTRLRLYRAARMLRLMWAGTGEAGGGWRTARRR